MKTDGNRLIHPDRLFPSEPQTRAVARRLYALVRDQPIVSPHGHTDAGWYADDQPFVDPASLFVIPDHYVFRLLFSQGVALEELGIRRKDGSPVEADARAIWRRFAQHYHLFRATPTRLWFDHVFAALFDLEERLSVATADHYFDRITERLRLPELRPRALFDRFNLEVIATTDSPLDSLAAHASLQRSGWHGRVIPAYRPDPVVDPEFEDFRRNLILFGEITGCDTLTWRGYLHAHRQRRAYFKAHGAAATDHGHPSALTADLSGHEGEALFAKAALGDCTTKEAELFRAHMLMEMAAMSAEDGLVMQIHPGSFRNHHPQLFSKFGRDIGADIPTPTNYVHALKPLLDRFGHRTDVTIIVFTLDETTYSRELAALAGLYPALRLGPAWWFFDSPEGMKRFREMTTETAGFYSTVGFNDDTRAYLSSPARHDVARHVDCSYLAELVLSHRLDEDEAAEVAQHLAYGLAKQAYKL